MTFINYSVAKVTADSLKYKGDHYPLRGASATYTETRKGLFGRKAVRDITITGPGWTVTGRCQGARHLASKINRRAARVAA